MKKHLQIKKKTYTKKRSWTNQQLIEAVKNSTSYRTNLRILCPNCHSLKSTHRGRNRRKNARVVE